MTGMVKDELSPNIAAAVILSACVSMNCTGDGGATIKCIKKEVHVKFSSQDGKILFDSNDVPSVEIPDCGGNVKANYLLEIRKPGKPEFAIEISRGKNGGWYASGKYLIGGVVTIMIPDCGNGNLYLVDPASYASQESKVKSHALIDKKSEELFISLKSSLPENIFEKLPLITLRKNKYLK